MGTKDRSPSVASASVAKPSAARDAERQRLDKWLWHTRLQPTRSKAAEFIRLGFARINGLRITDPAKPVKAGDVLTLALHNRTLVIRVLDLLPRRGSSPVAATAWEAVSPDPG